MMYPYALGTMDWWMLVWVGLCVVGIVTFIVLLGTAPVSPPPSDDNEARRILDARFARGEIEPQDYRDRRSLMR